MTCRLLRRSLMPVLLLAACTDDPPSTAPGGDPAAGHFGGHLVVTTLTDPEPDDCTPSHCTLREAIAAAPSGGEISFAKGLSGPLTLQSASGGELFIDKTLSITGPAKDGIILQRLSTDAEFRILQVGGSGIVAIANLTFTGGKLSTSPFSQTVRGGGISVLSGGSLTLTKCTVSGNGVLAEDLSFGFSHVSGGGISNQGILTLNTTQVKNNFTGGGFHAHLQSGGGIANSGTLTLTNTSVTGNSSTSVTGNSSGQFGGGINNDNTATLINSTISGNSAGLSGGGYASNAGIDVFKNSTVSGNSAIEGGGIIGRGTASNITLTNTTVASNSASEQGGGISTAGALTLTNSLLALNTAPTGPDIVEVFSGGGGGAPITGATITARFSLLGTTSGYTLDTDVNNIKNVDPNLAGLTNNGGPTLTHALKPGSPALDAGSTQAADCEPTDQRGITRPQGAACDIGSYERKVQGAK